MTTGHTTAGVDEHLFADFNDVVARQFDYVVVGAGCTGTIVAHQLLRLQPQARVLLLEQGPYLLPDHVQNLGVAFQPLMDQAVAAPWRSEGDLDVVAQVPYLGGRTLFWSGSCPQPARHQLRDWPAAVVEDLEREWPLAREILGVVPAGTLSPGFGELHRQLRKRVHAGAGAIAHVLPADREEELDAQLAVGVPGPAGPRKFSAVPLLLRALSRHPQTAAVVTRCHVRRLRFEGRQAVALETGLGTLQIGAARVILALGTTEATRLMLDSLPSAADRVGRNLAGNTASWFACRVPRSAFPGLSEDHAEIAALYVDAATGDRQFHLHVSASATADADRDLEEIYRLMPDMFGRGTPERVCDPDHVVILVHGLAELAASEAEPASRISVGSDGVTVGTFRLGPADRAVWDAMDRAATDLISMIVQDAEAEYWSPAEQAWVDSVPAERRMPFAVHETGTLWMGGRPDAVTNLNGRLHDADNVYVAGGALFPTRGSWNPMLTMTALCLRLARHLATPVDAPDGVVP